MMTPPRVVKLGAPQVRQTPRMKSQAQIVEESIPEQRKRKTRRSLKKRKQRRRMMRRNIPTRRNMKRRVSKRWIKRKRKKVKMRKRKRRKRLMKYHHIQGIFLLQNENKGLFSEWNSWFV